MPPLPSSPKSRDLGSSSPTLHGLTLPWCWSLRHSRSSHFPCGISQLLGKLRVSPVPDQAPAGRGVKLGFLGRAPGGGRDPTAAPSSVPTAPGPARGSSRRPGGTSGKPRSGIQTNSGAAPPPLPGSRGLPAPAAACAGGVPVSPSLCPCVRVSLSPCLCPRPHVSVPVPVPVPCPARSWRRRLRGALPEGIVVSRWLPGPGMGLGPG